MDALERESNIQQLPVLARPRDFPEFFFSFCLSLSVSSIQIVVWNFRELDDWNSQTGYLFTSLNTIIYNKSETE